jgi:hypothetical protein
MTGEYPRSSAECQSRHLPPYDPYFVEPNVFVPMAVEEVVHGKRDALDVGMPASRTMSIENDRPDRILT